MSGLTTPFVVDTNVLAVAEGQHPGASDACRAACVEIARLIQEGTVLVVDESDLILKEYLDRLATSKKSGIGSKLAQRLWRLRRDGGVCERRRITPIGSPPGSFEEVPERLRNFDVDDQKFIAVACASAGVPVFQALDEEWWLRRADLASEGLDVQFLCVSDLVAKGL